MANTYSHIYVSCYVAGLLADCFATFVERQLTYSAEILFCAANGTELTSKRDYNKSWVALESIVYVTEESESTEEFKVAINLNPTKPKSHSLLYIP